MKKLLATASVSVLSVIALSGCVTITPPASPMAVTESQTKVAPTETKYTPFEELKSVSYPETSATVETMYRLGEAVCGALDRGVSFHEVVATGASSATDPHLFGAIVGVSVNNICPEFIPDMQVFLKNNGSPSNRI